MEPLLSKLKIHTYSQKSPLSFCETPSIPNSQNMIFHVRIWKQNKLKTLPEVHVNVKKSTKHYMLGEFEISSKYFQSQFRLGNSSQDKIITFLENLVSLELRKQSASFSN